MKDILSKITQGEWKAKLNRDKSWVVMSGNIVIATLHRKDWPEWNESNAELIANAPQTLKQRDGLLKALEDFPTKTENQTFEQFYNCAMSWFRIDREQAIAEVEDSK